MTINWKEILGDEHDVIRCGYVIPKKPAVIASWVQAAVYRTLTSQDIIISQQEESLACISPKKTANVLKLLLEDLNAEKASKGYEDEYKEARRQGKIASRADLDLPQPFLVQYDYWQGKRRIGELVGLTSINGDSENLLLEAPTDHIGKNIGLPTNLLHRREEYKSHTALLDKATKLGLKEDDVIERALNFDLERHFDDSVGGRKYELLERMGYKFQPWDSAVYEVYHANRKLILRDVFAQLTPEEQKKVRRPQNHFVATYPSIEIAEGAQKARLHIIASFGVHGIGYDPVSGSLSGDLSNSRKTSLEISLNPIITSHTTHEALLALRNQGVVLADKAGISPPLRRFPGRG